MFDKKVDFERLAAMASSVAFFSFLSISMRSVMSSEVPMIPITLPFSSKKGNLLVKIHRSCPF